VVDDYEPWCRFVCSTIDQQAQLRVVGVASDGFEAIQKAQEVQPDLTVLDIGLPTLNGIEVAKRILALFPQSKILFLSQETSVEVVQEALATGARGYLVKADAGELRTALGSLLRGDTYVSRGIAVHDLNVSSDAEGPQSASTGEFATAESSLRRVREQGHVVQFYTDDAQLLDSLCPLFRDSLCAGGSVVALMTESHRSGVEKRLIAEGIDVRGAAQNGRFTILDAGQTLSEFMEVGAPNRDRFLVRSGTMIRAAKAAALVKNSCVVVFGEMVAVLWAQRKFNAAIRLEELWNELSLAHSFYLCCAYPANEFRGTLDGEPYSKICAQHSEVVAAF
jgi:DNA-binding NarL/FixJ family response regulator